MKKNGLINRIDILPDAERKRIVHEFNDTYADYPRDKTIQQLFEDQVMKTPNHIALVFNEERLTYDELNKRSNQLAHILRETGVSTDEIITIMVERSPALIISILGILKAGGAYLPIDSEYPKERISFMLKDSKTKKLLTQSGLSEKINFDGEVINLDENDFNKGKMTNLDVVNGSKDLAYVIYTSGSTGKPKGVMVEHRNLINLAMGQIKQTYQLDEHDRILQSSPISFDPSIEQIFIALLSGASLYLINREVLLNFSKFHTYLKDNAITYLYHVPSLLKNIDLEGLDALRVVVSGGEACPIELARRLCEKFEFYNGYGPAEATVKSAMYRVSSGEIGASIPIGKPVRNCKLFILKSNNRLSPIGVMGELYISGEGVARGYLNQPELTDQKFVDNPFIPGERMYRTGDLARWLPDGNIEFLGRIDDQVKIRGVRIEMGEIQNQLLKIDDMKEVVVVAREDEVKDNYLCVYYVSDEERSMSGLRQYLSEHLPDYMIPSYFVRLEKMPLTPNGKLDKKALPEPVGGVETAYIAPRNKTEEVLVQIWEDVLGKEQIGIHDNFFELGGHSLRATVIVSRIHKELSMELPLKALFKTPTISGISDYLSQATESEYATIEPVAEKEYYETSSAQKRMWLLQQFDQESIGYNMPSVFMIEGNLNRERVEYVFLELVNRHEILRTSFEMIEDVIVQKIEGNVAFELKYTEPTEDQIEEVIRGFIRPFNLSQAPLLRVGLISINEVCHYLMFDMHHIISDGVSMGILAKEFMILYEGQELEEQRIQYKDFSTWQNEYLKSEKMKVQERYWLEKFSDELPVLDLPLDYVRPMKQSYEGGSVAFGLGKELTEKLNNLAHQNDATLYMVLLSAINILLSKYTGQVDILIGSPIAGRTHVDLEHMLGMFVNTLVMRNHPEGDKRYVDFLEEVKESALKAYEYHGYQFEELVEKLDLRRDASRNPLFDVMFVLQNMEHNNLAIEGMKLTRYEGGQTPAKFDLTFTAIEINDEIRLSIEYGTKLFKQETIERMASHLCKVLHEMTETPMLRLSDIEILLKTERDQLLYKFNDTYADYPREKTIHQLFEEQVERTPNHIALVFNDEQLTYKELNEKTNQLAGFLRKRGVKSDDIVGIMVERSFEMIIGILGILKSGGAYLPIDPDYPEERIRFMLEDSKIDILLTQSWLSEKAEFKGKKINLDEAEIYGGDARNLEAVSRATDLAYVIYTSGSTGKPKGVMIEHRSVVNLSKWKVNDEKSSVLQNFNYIFDGSVWEILPTLLSGAILEIISEASRHDPEKLLALLSEKEIIMTPSTFQLMMNDALENSVSHQLHTFDKLYLGGETVPPQMIKRYKELLGNNINNMFNAYGPTEITVSATTYRFNQNDDRILIGKPISNTQIYILDAKSQPVPLGVSGELCIGGEGLARGYLNRPELTAEKFVDNPFILGERMYRTGDLARWLPDGNIEYLGRIDHQVKIRGFRIELGEIENQLLTIEGIKEAAVLAREDELGDKYLCAYSVSEEEFSIVELRHHLSNVLPDYMIPSYFVQLEKMPLTPNGKLDRKALPEPENNVKTEYIAPRNEIEEKLTQIWCGVLIKDRIGIYDNFFELGGHSLRATVIVSRIHKALNVELPLKELFRTPTISGISEYLSQATESEYANIEQVGEKEYYETSSAQKRMWLLQQFDLTSTAYNMPGVFRIEGDLDKSRLEYVFSELINRHELLRTRFEMVEDVIVQRIEKNIEFGFLYTESKEEQIEEVIGDFIHPFDLSKVALLRAGLIKVNSEYHYLMFDMHHIVSDGISMSIIAKEFMMMYAGQELEEQRIQYKDFSAWQQEYLKTEKMKEQEKYWLEQFSDEIPVLDLSLDYPRPIERSYEGESIEFGLGSELTEKLNDLARQNDATLYMVLLSAVNILLSNYTGQEDIIIGSPIAGRPHADLEHMLGMFVNTLVMRNHPEGKKYYVDFLEEVKETALKAYENQDYQFEDLVDQLDLQRDIGRNPLFDVMFVLQNMEERELEIEGLKLTQYISEKLSTKFDLTFTVIEVNGELKFSIEYGINLFKRETIKRMAAHLCKLLNEITKDTMIQLSGIDILSKAERDQLLYEFNDTYMEYPKDKTIHQLFEEQVERTPNHVALVFNDEQMTYSELNRKSNQVAKVLRASGVEPDDIVGITVERSFEMIIGILGILKSGGAYLPIDPDYPIERIKFMLEDSNAEILLTQSWLSEEIRFEGKRIHLDEVELYQMNAENLEIINTSTDLAYVIYTSGSTGKPKGVMVEHEGLTNYIWWAGKTYFENEDEVMALHSSIAFDLTVTSLFTALIFGNRIVIYSNDKTEISLLKMMKENKVTVVKLTPAHLTFLQNTDNSNSKIKRLIVGGEELKVDLVKEITNSFDGVEFYNEYGPTEATVGCMIYKYDEQKDIGLFVPIGRPIDNNQIYILDSGLGIVPIGIIGELCIGGEGLARGYLNRPELTAEKFVDNPFILGERMYRTGDLARWLPDGNIEFLGRIDHQVKIRGFRIELGEIENQLLKLEDVKEVVVIACKDETNDKYLCAYYLSEEEFSIVELRHHLSNVLPDYMIPSYFVQLEKMPLTPNGKLDRKALPEPENNVKTEYIAPRNEIEEKLTQIWCEVLIKDRIGINDNFFELGGHSLRATVVVSRIHKVLNVELPLKELFKTPTISGISDYLSKIKESIYQAIEPVSEKNYYEASSAQKRMWLLQQFDQESTAYNMPSVLVVEGNLDKQRLEKAFLKLIDRHETFRTSFDLIDDEVVQKIAQNVPFKIGYIESTELMIRDEFKKFNRPFELTQAPLLRVELVKTESERHYLMFDMHHIISDGISMTILVREVMSLYEGLELEALRIQYKDFSAWQNSYLKSEQIEKQEQYWLEKFTGEIPVLDLPLDYVRPVVQSFESASVNFTVNQEITEKLNKLARETGTTLYMVLLSVIQILLAKYSRQEDIIIGSPIAGRPHADLEGIIGMFVNTLAMRSYPESGKTYEEFLIEVKETALKAYENQDYQFEDLVDKLDLRRDMSHNPLFDVMFTLQNTEESELAISELIFTEYSNGQEQAKFDLTFTAREVGEAIAFNVSYATSLFKQETIERMIEHFNNLLNVIVRFRTIQIGEIELLSKIERSQLLYDFNSTYTEYPRNKTIHQLFEEQVEKTPDKIALVFNEESMTYHELNMKSNQLARILRTNGVEPDEIVGIMVERSFEMVIAILGILKSGGAYLPIDSKYPKERIKFMLEDSGAKVLLMHRLTVDQIEFEGEIINLDNVSVYQSNALNLDAGNNPSDLAYVIYTSGSTGMPKGVMVEHKNVVNLLYDMERHYPLETSDSYLLKTAYAFDVSVTELFGWFVAGVRVVILNPGFEKSPKGIIDTISKNKITHINFVPSMLHAFIEESKNNQVNDLQSLKHIFVAGEALKQDTVRSYYELFENSVLENLYGPTEATIFSTRYTTNMDELNTSVPIGKPISNTKVYILDTADKPVPLGVSGELCIGGKGLARGYLNRPELTAEKFVDNPFIPGERMYRTGDLARWLPDGNIEFLGRIDHQVKIRGFRIELGEIENQLLKIGSIKEVVVIAREDETKDSYLCGYYVSDEELLRSELKEHLSEYLPEYMMPSYFVQLEKMPLTPNGKLDRKALPELVGGMETEYVAPRNAMEEVLVSIWSEVLGREQIGINDNFFELGGHSLRATVIISRIHKKLSVELPLKELFKTPTISGVGDYLSKTKESIYQAIEPVAEKDYYETSSAQKRMYVMWMMDKESIAYNMTSTIMLEGEIDIGKLERTIQFLVNHHEILRTSFLMIDNELMQKVHNQLQVEISYHKLDKMLLQERIQQSIQPFDLMEAPLLRIACIEVSRSKQLLVFDIHHIIFDGLSRNILVQDFMTLYADNNLRTPRIQYKDYAVWHNQHFTSNRMRMLSDFWIAQMQGFCETNLPETYYNGEGISKILEFLISNKQFQKLNSFSQESEITKFTLMLGIFKLILMRILNQDYIAIGLPVAGRQHDELESMVGMFLNTLVSTVVVDRQQTFRSYIFDIRDRVSAMLSNQDYPYENLYEDVRRLTGYQGNSLFSIMFNYMPYQEEATIVLDNVTVTPYELDEATPKYGLTLYVVERKEEMILQAVYKSTIEESIIGYILNGFQTILNSVIANPEILLEDIHLNSEISYNYEFDEGFEFEENDLLN